ncbi:H-2 class I histocompatibility antigen, D-K alpha chain-like [Apteryx mantelli]|uniref:H-2 class I histocompatibility antigen, D-K alpha chain-like n=1 Tax=Apteryx mantelli TaxID=2696672 RepID=A0ABM4FXN0_9AVES
MGLGRRVPLPLLGLLLAALAAPRGRCGPHSLRYRYAAVSEPGRGLPGFVGVGFVDERPFLRYDSETQRARPQVAWAAERDAVYWAEETLQLQGDRHPARDTAGGSGPSEGSVPALRSPRHPGVY